MTADQLKTGIQLDRTSGWVATSLSNSNTTKCEAQATCADLGMCLVVFSEGVDKTSLTVGDAVEFPEGESALGVRWFRQALDCVPASNGGLFEPEHGLLCGPCL